MIARLKLCGMLALRLIRVFFQILYGAWKISVIKGPYISIFGGAQFAQNDPYAQKAYQLAQMLVVAEISVLTGGGPGIMEAASCGAFRAKTTAKSIGIGVKDLGEVQNKCTQIYFELDYFFARKWLLTHYSSAFVIFPGGFGTLDELTEVLTLIRTKKLNAVPIVLIGIEYWKPFMYWLEHEAVKHGAIKREDLALFTLTDDLDQAFCLVRDECNLT